VIAGAVIGEQGADVDAETQIVGHSGHQEAHGRRARLVGQDLGEGNARVVIDWSSRFGHARGRR
jgi:hypothetical protein